VLSHDKETFLPKLEDNKSLSVQLNIILDNVYVGAFRPNSSQRISILLTEALREPRAELYLSDMLILQ
jgi:hypothetical protein